MLTDAQKQEAKNDLLLADIELRLEQVRSLRRYEDWRFVIQAITAFAAVFAAGGVVGGLIVRLTTGHYIAPSFLFV
jgi:hypothetical protein